MSFLHAGLFAAGAAAISIPIIIHFLFKRRRKPVIWAAMRFLIEAHRKHQRRLKLEQLLLLAARCLLLLLIALAIGRPIAQSAAAALGFGGGRTVYFLIDNSLASSARADTDSPTALERHKEQAQHMLAALGSGDRAGLIALGSPAQLTVAPPSADLSAVSGLIDSVEPTDSRSDFSGAISAVARAIRTDTDTRAQNAIAVFSDFRLGSVDVSSQINAALAGASDVKLIATKPASDPQGNVQIVSATPLRLVALTQDDTGSTSVDVRIQLRRVGSVVGEAGSSTVLLALEDEHGKRSSPSSSIVRWRPGQAKAELITTLTIDPVDESHHALVATIDRDAIEGDNITRRPIEVRSAIRVGVAARRRFGRLPAADALAPEDWLRLALAPTDAGPINVIDVDPAAIDGPTLAALDALLIPRPDLFDAADWRRLAVFTRRGGMAFIMPPPDVTVHLWPDEMNAALGLPWRLAREATIYEQGASLENDPTHSTLLELIAGELTDLTRSVHVFRTLPVTDGATAPGVRTVLRLEDGSPWLLASTVGAPSAVNGDSAGTDEMNSASARGLVVYLTSAPTLNWTDLPARPFIVPLIQELVRQGVGEAEGGNLALAGERPQPAEHVVELAPVDVDSSNVTILVAPTGLASQPIRRAGLWRAIDRQGVTRSLLAVNADPDAGQTEIQTPQVVRDWLLGSGVSEDSFQWIDTKSAPSTLTSAVADTGSALSFPLLIAAAALALLELIMARLFSYARQTGDTAGKAAPQ